ncbi:MAG: mechanosensitive ion channel family protein, partial [Phaeodactylibacter sp.]|nr:mechanosensitive ion channel family protein [Phaeodactylibacter sp.]
MRRFSNHVALQSWVGNSIRIVVILVGTFVALDILHLNKAVTSLLAGAGIVGLALSFAFQDLAQNLVSGLYLAFRRPIKVGDVIETGDYFGEVTNIGIRNSIVKTFDGQDLFLPNKYLFQDPVHNYSTGQRRIVLKVGVSYGEDLDHVEQVTLDAVKTLQNLMPGKEPQFYYEEYGDSSINYRLHLWVPYSEQRHYFDVQSEAIKAIHKAYGKAGITIPFPIRTLDFGIKGGERIDQSLGRMEIVKNGQN